MAGPATCSRLRSLKQALLGRAEMMGREDPVEHGVELNEPLNNGSPGLEHPAVGQGTSSCSNSNADQQNVENGLRQREAGAIRGRRRFTLCCSNRAARLLKKHTCASIIFISFAILSTSALITSVSFNFIQHEEKLKLEEKLKQLQSTTTLPPSTPCPPKWIKYEWKNGKSTNGTTCFFFSDPSFQENWDFSQSYCSSYGASLVTILSPEEWAFLKRNKPLTEYWLNLRKGSEAEPWAWPDGSRVGSWLHVGGRGLCGYLNEKAASSTNCDNIRSWICTMPASST